MICKYVRIALFVTLAFPPNAAFADLWKDLFGPSSPGLSSNQMQGSRASQTEFSCFFDQNIQGSDVSADALFLKFRTIVRSRATNPVQTQITIRDVYPPSRSNPHGTIVHQTVYDENVRLEEMLSKVGIHYERQMNVSNGDKQLLHVVFIEKSNSIHRYLCKVKF